MTLTLPIRIDHDSAPDETLYTTASGLPVLIYNINGGGNYPIHGAFFKDGTWIPLSWTASGFRGSADHVSAFDLRDRAPAKRGWWARRDGTARMMTLGPLAVIVVDTRKEMEQGA